MDASAKDRKAAGIQELIKGRELAVGLNIMVQSGDSLAAGRVLKEVISSFSQALHLFGSGASNRCPVDDESLSDEPKNESYGKKRKTSGAGRGGFRKRKHGSVCKRIISKTSKDEYSWRKYGQKEIHGSKFPRSYFRCTHKYDQGCQATKQVQKSEDDPSLLMITYIGEHTCSPNIYNIVPNLAKPSNSSEPSIISFGSNISYVTHDLSLPSFPLISKLPENEEEVLSNPKPSTPSSEFIDLPSIYEGCLLEPLMNESVLQHSDGSARNFNMSFMLDSFNFEEDVLAFDQGHLFSD